MVAQLVRLRRKFDLYFRTIIVAIASFALSTGVFANPALDNVAHGNVSVQQTTSTTTVNQTSQKAIINWKSFNIGSNEHTHFNQPNGGVALNRISPNQGASEIYGKLSATGKIILVNPAGVFIGPNAFINVGALIASTAGISDENFLNGYYNFNQISPYAGAIVNKGTIIAAEHGLVALMGHAVSNEGMIQANVGKVAIGAGETFTMSFAGNDLISFAINDPATVQGRDHNGNVLPDGVKNTGKIIADGGSIMIHAKAAQGVLDNAINLDGLVQAKSVMERKGQIIFSSELEGIVKVKGKVDASSENAKGGKVQITGKKILVEEAEITVSGHSGGGEINIGGNYLGQGPLPNSEAVVLAPGITIEANAITEGDGGTIIVWSDEYTNVLGDLSARGGALSGDGGFIETSSKKILNVGDVLVNTSAPNGEAGMWLLDPNNITISGSATSGGTFNDLDPNVFTPTAVANVLNTTINTNLASTDVTVTTSDGTITVSSAITWTSANTLKLDAAGAIVINAAISGVNGGLELSTGALASTITTGASGTIDVNDFHLIRGTWSQTSSPPTFNVNNDFQVDSGVLPSINAKFLRVSSGTGGSGTPYIVDDIYGFQGFATHTDLYTQYFNLNSDIDATRTINWNGGKGWVPIAFGVGATDSNNTFTRKFDGNNHTISNLYINRDSDNPVGLFGSIGTLAVLKNLFVTDATIIVNDTYVGSVAGTVRIGVIVGIQNHHGSALSSNLFATGTIQFGSAGTPTTVGGRIGGFSGSFKNNLTNVYAGVDITVYSADGAAQQVGGFVGALGSSDVNTSYSSGNVTGVLTNVTAGTLLFGGFTGNPNSFTAIKDSYSTGSVTVSGTRISGDLSVGGFAGWTSNQGKTIRSYSSGAVSNTSTGGTATYVGGFVGEIFNAGVNNSTLNYWDVISSGQLAGYGAKTNTGAMLSTNLYGGCFTGVSCTPTAQTGSNTASGPLNEKTTYVGWTVNNAISAGTTPTGTKWTVFEGLTRPMLVMEWNTNVRTPHQLQLMGMAIDADYTLINDIDLAPGMTNAGDIWATTKGVTGDGFIPIGAGTSTTAFLGTFDGQNYEVQNLYINRPTTNFVGLFGAALGNISNIGVTDVDITGKTFVGGLVGQMSNGGTNTYKFVGGSGVAEGNVDLTINNAYTTGTINSLGETDTNTLSGGLVGFHSFGTISNSYSTVDIKGKTFVGGLTGDSFGPVIYSYATGNVEGTKYLGGLIGQVVFSSTSFSYSTGNVTGGTEVGGLIGRVVSGATVSNSYSTGTTSGSSVVGAFIGENNITVTSSFYDSDINSNAAVGSGLSTNITGLSTSNMMLHSSFSTAWSTNITKTPETDASEPTNAWFIFDGNTRPMLMMRYTTDIKDAYELQLAGTTLGADYTLANDIDLGDSMRNKNDVWGTDTKLNSGPGFAPIGDNTSTSSYTGTFDGQGYVIKNLYINYTGSTQRDLGLFGNIEFPGVVKNIGLIDPDINFSGTGNTNTGTLVGQSFGGTIDNSYSSGGTITASVTPTRIGGLVGLNFSKTSTSGGHISNSYSTTDIFVTSPLSSGIELGGFVGGHYGGTSLTSTITNSYSSGNVTYEHHTNSGLDKIAGFVGRIRNFGGTASINNAYSTGTVRAFGETLGSDDQLAGFAARNDSTITNVYSTSPLFSTAATISGLVGNNTSGTVTNGFWDVDTSGVGTDGSGDDSDGGTGKSTANMMTANTFTTPWGTTEGVDGSITSTPSGTSVAPDYTWFIFDGGTRPMLMSEYSSTIRNAHQLQLAGSTLGADYTLGSDVDMNAGMTNTSDVWATNNNTPTGKGFVPIGNSTNNFTGSFDGQSYTIDSLYMNYTHPETDHGLIGYADIGTNIIQRVGLTNVSIRGGDFTGGLVGRFESGLVSEAYVTGSVTASRTSVSQGVGGLVGWLHTTSSVTDSYSTASVTGIINGSLGVSVGGLVGSMNTTGSITNSYSSGLVTGSGGGTNAFTGGLVGFYNTGTAGPLTNNFFDSTTSTIAIACGGNNASCGGITPKTTDEMLTASTFSSWDITSGPSSILPIEPNKPTGLSESRLI